MKQFGGAWPTMVTPLDAQFKIDRGGYRSLVEWYITHHSGGLYANCATSEMDLLSPHEQIVLVEEAVAVSEGRIPVAATGNTGNGINEQLDLCRRVAGAGADIVMLVVPAGMEDDDTLEKYFMTFADKVEAHLGIYEWPIAGMKHLSIELVEKLAASGRFVAYKEPSCELEKIKTLWQVTQSTPLSLLQANIPYLLPFINAGGRGTMSIASAVVPDLVDAVIRAAQAGGKKAGLLHQTLCAFELAQRAVHPAGSKYLLHKRGVPMASRTRRTPNDLSAEQRTALDYAATQWFDEAGELRMQLR